MRSDEGWWKGCVVARSCVWTKFLLDTPAKLRSLASCLLPRSISNPYHGEDAHDIPSRCATSFLWYSPELISHPVPAMLRLMSDTQHGDAHDRKGSTTYVILQASSRNQDSTITARTFDDIVGMVW